MFYGYIIVSAGFFLLAVIWGTSLSYGIFFDSWIQAFGWNRAELSGAASINNIVLGVFFITTAKLCERFPPKIIIAATGVVLALGFYLLSYTQTLWQLYLFYGVIVALGMSAYIVTLSIVARWFNKRRGLVTGIVFSGMSAGTMILPPVTSQIISTYGWQSAMLILAIIALVIMIAASQFIKREPKDMGLKPYGSNETEVHHGAASGISMKQALRTGQFWIVCALYFIFVFCQIIIMVHVVIHAIGLGVSPGASSLILFVYGLVGIIGVNAVGLAADRFGNKICFTAGFALTVVAFLILIFARSMPTLYLFAGVFGLAWGGTQVLFSPVVAELFGLRAHSVILASAGFAGCAGAAIGPFAAGYIFDVGGSYYPAFILSACLAAGAALMALMLRPIVTLNSNR